MGRLRCGRGREHEARASADLFLADAAGPTSGCTATETGFFPYVGGEVKDVFEALKAAWNPTWCSRTRATISTGPSARMRAHLEHVATPHPRVRDPEVRRGPRTPNVFVPVTEELASEKVGGSSRRSPASATSTGSTRSSCSGSCGYGEWRRARPRAMRRRSPDGSSPSGSNEVRRDERRRACGSSSRNATGRARILRADLGRGRVRERGLKPALVQCSISHNRVAERFAACTTRLRRTRRRSSSAARPARSSTSRSTFAGLLRPSRSGRGRAVGPESPRALHPQGLRPRLSHPRRTIRRCSTR